jgi:hypothetical protein
MDGGVVHLCSVASLATVLALLASSASQTDAVLFFWHSSRRASISSCAHQCDHKSGAGAGQALLFAANEAWLLCAVLYHTFFIVSLV